MIPILSLILPALVPVASDAIRSVVAKVTGGAGAQPQNVEEAIALKEADTERLRALAEIDRPAGNISQWVADLRASFRYIAAGAILLNAFIAPMVPGATLEYINMSYHGAGSVWSFMFGDRMYSYIKRR